MKPILDLTKAINNYDYFHNQFKKWGNEKNILFISPQLSGKCLYKTILPFFSMFSEKVATAINGLGRYDYDEQLLGCEGYLVSDDMIQWADFIVFPFTTQPLVVEFYESIKNIKPDVKVVFLVDFNFYELSLLHPYKYLFDEPTVLSAVEDNIWFSDICLTSNSELAGFLIDKFRVYSQSKYKNTPSDLRVACMPYMIDVEIVLKNVDYEPIKGVLISNEEHISSTKKHIQEVSEKADEIKLSNIQSNGVVDVFEEKKESPNDAIVDKKEKKHEQEKTKINKPKRHRKTKSPDIAKQKRKTIEKKHRKQTGKQR